jgi:hypothetical protein
MRLLRNIFSQDTLKSKKLEALEQEVDELKGKLRDKNKTRR